MAVSLPRPPPPRRMDDADVREPANGGPDVGSFAVHTGGATRHGRNEPHARWRLFVEV